MNSPEWVNTLILVLTIGLQLIGFFGLFLVFFPGLTIIWMGQLLWAIYTGFNSNHEPWQFGLTITFFVINTILMVGGSLVDNFFMAGGARQKGTPWWEIGITWLTMIVVSFILTPVGGLAAALLVLFLVEYQRNQDAKKAFESTKAMATGCGWGVVSRLGIAMLMIILWIIWWLVF